MATLWFTCHEAIARNVVTWALLPFKIPLPCDPGDLGRLPRPHACKVEMRDSVSSPTACCVESRFAVLWQQETKQAAVKQRLMPRDATGCTIVQPVKVELDGLEPTTPALQTRCSPN